MQKHILIIEDELSLCNIYKEILEHEGYKVSFAGEGKEGLRKAVKEKPDLVILDLILPGIDGFDVLRRLKKDKATKGIPVIILTVVEGQQDVARGLELGADGYLFKSTTNLDQLVEVVKRHT